MNVMTVEQVAQALYCSKRRVFELLSAGVLKRAVSFGRRTLVTVESVDSLYDVPPARQRKPRSTQWVEITSEDVDRERTSRD